VWLYISFNFYSSQLKTALNRNWNLNLIMSQILLLLDHKENNRLLTEWLSTRHEILSSDSELIINRPFNLLIIDSLALDRLWTEVQTRKQAEEPVFLPVLLITSRKDVGMTTRHLWKSVDELIISPIEKLELQVRVENLLRARKFSLELEHRFRNLFDGVPIGLYRTTATGQILDVNLSLVKMLGYPDRDTLLSANAADFYVNPDDRRRWQALMDRDGGVRNYEKQCCRSEGSIIWLEDNAHTVRDSNGRVLYYEGSFVDITERKRAEEQSKSSHQKLRVLSAHLQSVREKERIRISREIHDELGQILTVLKMELLWLEKRLSGAKKEAPLQQLQKRTREMLPLINKSIESVQRISTELRPGVLDDLGLIATLEWQVKDFQKRLEIQCNFSTNLDDSKLDQNLTTALFRIFQEIMTNVARHANAARVDIRLMEEDGYLTLEVKDNGRGILESEIVAIKSLGLLGMRERVHFLNGEINITGIPGVGTTISVRIPLQSQTLSSIS
jgi:PAS domain S-box-containing protein